jgi:hypothetical protein
MSEAKIDDFSVQLEFTVAQLNTLLNIMNNPMQGQTIAWSWYMNELQRQAEPQIAKAQAALDAIKKTEEKKDEK